MSQARFTVFAGAISVACSLAGCAAAPKTITASNAAGQATLILAAPSDYAFYTHVFRRVDLAKREFIGDPLLIEIDNVRTFQALIGAGAYNQINSDVGALKRPAALAVQQLPAGDYVRVEAVMMVGYGAGDVTTTFCMWSGAPVYEIRGGETSIVRVDDVSPKWKRPADQQTLPAGQQILDEYQRARTAYPGLHAEAAIVRPKAIAQWKYVSGPWFSERKCAEPTTFELIAESK
jgi:hypothetical protein